MRERLVLAASALAALVLAAGTAAGQASARPDGGIPRRVHHPDPWLPGTDVTGPPGTIAVLQQVAHARARWFSLDTGPGLLAVSAENGHYAYLDLPHWQPGSHATLSPDGRYVAWFELDAPSPAGDVASRTLGLYDATTGRVRHRRLPVDGVFRGILPDVMLWGPGSTVLVVPTCETRLPHAATCESHHPTLVEVRGGRATSGRRLALTDRAGDDTFVSGGDLGWGPDGLVLVTGPGRTLRPVDPATAGPGVHALLLADRPVSVPVLSPHGTAVAFLDARAGARRLALAAVAAPGARIVSRPVATGWSVYAVVGWRDERTVVVLGSQGRRVAALAVDSRTGTVTPYLTLDRPVEQAPRAPDSLVRDQLQLARDLLAQPQPAGTSPGDRSDPRIVVADAVLAVGLLIVLARGAARRLSRRRAAQRR